MVAAIPLMFGIIQYGLYFNDSLQARQGVRYGARAAVINPTTFAGCATGTYAAKIKCYAKSQVSPVTGTVRVRVLTPDGSWAKANRLLVCTEVQSAANVGIIPVPNKGVVRAKTSMSIEQAGLTTTDGFPEVSDAALDSDSTWSWCT